MATKNTKKTSKTPEKKENSHDNHVKKVHTMLTAILVLVVLQFVLMLGIVLSMGDESSDAIEAIDSKVSRIDNFFKANVQGYGSGDSVEETEVETTTVTEPNTEGRPFIGSADASVTIVEYSDFECPFCQRFYNDAYMSIKENYIDTGKVKLVFKHFPLSFHQQAKPAAMAAHCVYESLGNDAFFEIHDTIFENQNSLTSANLKTWATDLGVDEMTFDSCMVDPNTEKVVDDDFSEGASLGVSGTPSFVINGELIVGAQPYSVFEQVLDSQLQG